MEEGYIKSILRGLSVIEVLGKEKELGVTELGDALGLNKSTVFSIIKTLEFAGYLYKNPKTGKYKLSLKLYSIGREAFNHLDIIEVIKPYLEKLSNKYQETIHLVAADRREVVYIDKIESNQSVRICSKVGERLPMHCTGVGKAILAYQSDKEIEEYIREKGLTAYTKNTITEPESFRQELKNVVKNGYSLDNEEVEEGLFCIAAPIYNFDKEIVYAISVSGPKFRMTEDKVKNIVKDVKNTCREISQKLGYM
ncbi:Pectin degradation repressor protein KdgR [Clostridium formicaceticum]|uniref:Pectin degradation repressor protein KdgR n=1 Tax=Clostridium formicaceticum TaxID=1497 RepID=A0AAC9RQR7_9CLOT|nr:IclR family transcriptional regulator [Clostridium formicaceticum]AOY77943.1 hypothetical protein BJL90_20000 [Clostridium formicaceticum]ARE88565.1 Pectin degradation repressor protein KdgR [Clostridium formicaceticum]